MKLPIKETLTTVCLFSILAGLGTWQIQRLQWKQGIIDNLEQYYEGAATLQDLSEGLLDSVENSQNDFAYGEIGGHLIKSKAVLLGPKTNDGRVGYHLLLPLTENDRTLIVNAGWVSDMWKDTLEERLAMLPSDVSARGVVRHPDWSSLASQNSPEDDMWFRADTAEIAKARELNNSYHVVLYADQIVPELHDVVPHEDKWLPRNKHLQYALFWYAMGLALLGVYGFYIHDRFKKKAP